MTFDEFGKRAGKVPAQLAAAHAEATKQTGAAIAEAFDVVAAGAGVRPGAALPRASGKGWPGAQVRGGGKTQVTVGLSNPAQLVIGATKTAKHVIGGKGLGTRAAISTKVAAAGPASFSKRRKGAKALKFPNGGVRLYVSHPGSKRKDVWPAMTAEAGRVGPLTQGPATRRAFIKAGIGH